MMKIILAIVSVLTGVAVALLILPTQTRKTDFSRFFHHIFKYIISATIAAIVFTVASAEGRANVRTAVNRMKEKAAGTAGKRPKNLVDGEA